MLDANTGQNALSQVRAFDDALGLTGLVLTKLDGSAKGGVVVGIRDQLSAWKDSPATTLILQGPNRKTMETLAELCL